MTIHDQAVQDAIRLLMRGSDPQNLKGFFGSEVVEEAMERLEERI